MRHPDLHAPGGGPLQDVPAGARPPHEAGRILPDDRHHALREEVLPILRQQHPRKNALLDFALHEKLLFCTRRIFLELF